MISEELKRLGTWEERHRRLASRLVIVLAATAVVDAIGTTLIYVFERGVRQTDIHSVFDAFFFTSVQLLTVSSQIKNPLTLAGRIVDLLSGLGSAGCCRIGRRYREFFPDWRLEVIDRNCRVTGGAGRRRTCVAERNQRKCIAKAARAIFEPQRHRRVAWTS